MWQYFLIFARSMMQGNILEINLKNLANIKTTAASQICRTPSPRQLNTQECGDSENFLKL
jgi:hypothetical protein